MADLDRFRRRLREEYERRFPRSREALDRAGGPVLDACSHAIRWNEPFMPVVARAAGAIVEDLDGNRLVDYWQGHFSNLLGHNPEPIRRALTEALRDGRGLQTGMLHEVEREVAETVCRLTGVETLRFTTSGSLGTFYAVLLARAFTKRHKVLKVAGGWHGSQPFGLKGVAARGDSFDHMESEGLSPGAPDEIVLTRFNDVEELRRTFEEHGDSLACFLVEPMLGSGGGMVAREEYLAEARRLTRHHGALLLCDEIITGFRFHAGVVSTLMGVEPDLLVLGKVLGGGMPVAAVGGRLDVLDLCSRERSRVKFEGGTYSAHELSLIAARTQLALLEREGEGLYAGIAKAADRLRAGIRSAAESEGVPVHLTGEGGDLLPGSSLVFVHVAAEGSSGPASPEELAACGHPLVSERLLKSCLILEGVSARTGLGAVSTAHTDADLASTIESYRATFRRLRLAGLVGG